MTYSPTDRLLSAVENFPVVIVPGLRNSDEFHWQSLWQARLPNSKRITVNDWATPDLDAWRAGIKAELDKLDKPAVLIAHSFGTLASASIAAEFPEKIAALFLVAPADPNKFGIADKLPQDFLPVTAKLIASSDDPWMTEAKAAYWALLWGADYLRIKRVGHINSESNLGTWTEGLHQLKQLVLKARARLKPKASQEGSLAFQ
ncbi:RBBP9/YdeN family alpha/beta hydrolase [Cellvibrio sp.]|uniref:RBBP9/YdeN family alpha/beta hydrolase n=1 Tax=Cellvibrio sp. TaxID=1965322 RepID=UPI0039647AEE